MITLMTRAWGAIAIAGCVIAFVAIGGELAIAPNTPELTARSRELPTSVPLLEPLSREIPDPVKTPGEVASTDVRDVCGFVGGLSYSKRHRATTSEMKAEVRRRYGATHCGEIDHRLMLALGGADTVQNLWCQPSPDEAVWNFKLKDDLEKFVWSAVCREHLMSLAEGQAVFLRPDWRIEYCRLIGGEVCR